MRAAGPFGWLGLAIVAAILAGSPTQGGGCARCGGSRLHPDERFMSQSQPSSAPNRFNPAEAGY